MKRIIKLYNFIFILLFLRANFVNAQADYEEVGGVVVMEAESFDIVGTGWEIQNSSDFSGFTGSGYIRSPEGNIRRIISSTTFDVKIKINTPGKYILKVKSRVGAGTSAGDSNDAWIKFEESEVDYFGEKPEGKVWPVDSGKTPNIASDGGVDGFFKVYSASGLGQWTWFSRTCNRCSYAIFAEFATAGIYTMLLSSRSTDYLIDRIILSNKEEDISIATDRVTRFKVPVDANTSEVSFVLATSVFDLSKSGITIYPNPTQEILNIQGLRNNKETINIIDMLGRVLPANIVQLDNELLQLSTTALAPGLYFVRIGDLGQSAFLVE